MLLLSHPSARLPRIGGSHAQREVFEDSLIVAYLRSGQIGQGRIITARAARPAAVGARRSVARAPFR